MMDRIDGSNHLFHRQLSFKKKKKKLLQEWLLSDFVIYGLFIVFNFTPRSLLICVIICFGFLSADSLFDAAIQFFTWISIEEAYNDFLNA